MSRLQAPAVRSATASGYATARLTEQGAQQNSIRSTPVRKIEGRRIITAYFLLAYVGPLLANQLFADHIESSYKLFPLNLLTVISIAGSYSLFLMLSSVEIQIFPPLDAILVRGAVGVAGRLYRKYRLMIGLVGVVLGAMSLSTGLTSYRYSEVGMSDSGFADFSLLLAVIVINLVITGDFFYRIFAEPRTAEFLTRRRFVENVVLAMALVTAADGVLSLLIGLFAMFHAVSPRACDRMVFSRSRPSPVKTMLTVAISILMGLAVYFVAELFGTIIKMGRTRDIAVVLADTDLNTLMGMPSDESLVTAFFFHFVERVSIFFYSLQLTTSGAFNDLLQGLPPALSYPLQTLGFRIGTISGGLISLPRPIIGSIMGLNYELLVATPFGSRPGTAPGLLASFNYVFGIPFNLVFTALYLRWVAKVMDDVLRRNQAGPLSIIGIVTFLLLGQVFFQSPFDWLMVVDGSVIYMLIIWSIAVANRDPGSRAVATAPIARLQYGHTRLDALR